jgi:hypothetical protein
MRNISFFFRDKLKKYIVSKKSWITLWHKRVSRWVSKATNTHSEYTILIAFVQKQWLHERAWILRYTRIASIVLYCVTVFFMCSVVIYILGIHIIINIYIHPRWHYVFDRCWGKLQELHFISSVFWFCALTWKSQ